MSSIVNLKVMLFTLGNVEVRKGTESIYKNETADPVTARRSQELYDALVENLNISMWACGRYGQHSYSPELGKQYSENLLCKLREAKVRNYDCSLQMAGHPIIHHEKPSFIIVDYIPYFDLAVFDKHAFPYVKKTYEMDQDFLYREATGVITYTPVQRYMLINWLGIDPCKVTSICSGVNGFVDEKWQKTRSKNILWIGADYMRKGGDDVVEAYLKLKEKDPEYSLTMVGNFDREIYGPDIVTYPFSPDNEALVDELYKRAGVFVMPSYKENLGLVYLEAMAHKTPVVVTSRGGLAEIVRRTGCGEITIPGNIDLLCHKIEKILDPDAYALYSERAFYFAKHNATWNIASSRIVDAMTKWLNGLAVPDDYNDYSMSPEFSMYCNEIKEGIR